QTQRADIKKEIQYIKSQDRLPIRRFGEKHVEVFSSSIVELIQTKDEEAKKVLFSNLLRDVTVYADNIVMSGSKLKMLSMVSKMKGGTSNLVPPFISNWRRDRDLNPRYAINV
ncbi:hypothetical protein CGH21_25510, partial [Vibrio parahaemolyticus]